MTIRIIQQRGQAYGNIPTSILVLLDGIEIYSGPVLTVDETFDYRPGTTNVLFSWGQEVTDTVPKNLEISVTGSQLALTDTYSDQTDVSDLTAFQELVYIQTIDSIQVWDPYTNVIIGGTPRYRGATPEGQWYWTIPAGSTFQATFNCDAGIDYPEWDASTFYPPESTVVYQNACYISSTVYPATTGIPPPSDRQGWIALPIPEWDINVSYIIYDAAIINDLNNPRGYIAIQNVPSGIDINDTNYWLLATS